MTEITTRAQCEALDASDPLSGFRDKFVVPENTIYLDGNSLGLMPKSAESRLRHVLQTEWSQDLITSWNKHGWFNMPLVLGQRLSRLIGGGQGNVVIADTISVNLFKLLSAALAMRPDRKTILSDSGNFPSDLYVAQGLNTFLQGSHNLETVDPEAVENAIDHSVAVVMLTEIDYRTARKHDMKALIAKAHDHGALVIWDLSHSAGAIPVDLMGSSCDFAVGCTYKYLNAGPGAPAFLFVHPDHQKAALPALVGWWGHANPFAFDTKFEPAAGVARFQAGTQPILSLAALESALDIWDHVDMQQLHQKSKALCSLFVSLVEQNCGSYGLSLAGPRDFDQRGSHVSFHAQNGYAIMQALIARNVIGDFRNPDFMRFGFAPLYNSFTEVWDAAMTLHDVQKTNAWNHSEFQAKKFVT
jgi:kynureninase